MFLLVWRKPFLMHKIKYILNTAYQHFLNKEYDMAIFLYSQALSIDPDNFEYKLYLIICDIATENSEKGQELFDHFLIKKELDPNIAISFIKDAISLYDGDNELVMKLLNDMAIQNIESLDAIEYEDFQKMILERGSFREAYEDIVFSTRIIIKSKYDLIDFIEQLIDNNFGKTAYAYLDNFETLFTYDKKVLKLYEKLEEKTSENNQK